MTPFFRRAAVALVALATPLLLAACGDDSKESAPKATGLIGYALKPPMNSADLSVANAVSGAPVALKAAPGGLRFVYFGYTHCPDVCPTMLAAVKSALTRVEPDDAAKVDLVMITVDPDRDTAEILPGYVQSFNPAWLGLRTDDPDELAKVADRFGVSYSVTTDDKGEIQVSHTGTAFVVDDTGTIVDSLLFGVSVADVTNDISYLLAGGRA